jgi:hypothetical protein
MNKRASVLFTIVVVLVAGRSMTSARQTADKTVWDGVYTEDQSARGKETFTNACSSCHELGDFTGTTFINTWKGSTAFDLFKDMSSLMPQDAPGSLMPQAYIDIVAFMFKSNSFPAGTTELPPDENALKQIHIVPKPGTN